MTIITRLFAVCAGLLIAGSAGAAGQYPDHPVRIVVGFAAGGPTDVIARLVAERLSASLGQQFYVEDKPGAGSNIASAEVAKAAPDGYTLTVISTGFMVNMSLYAHVPYDAIKDFTPVTMVAYSPNVLVVNPKVEAKSVKELVALIKANPGKYSFAGPGIGSTPHLSGELFKQKLGLEIIHVPYPGAAPAITSTIGGHTPIAFTALPPALANVQSGKLRALAILATKRSDELPDVPTMQEAGYSGQEADTLTGVMAPAGTPKAIVDLLNREIAKAVAQPDVAAHLRKLGFVPVADKPEEFGARIKSEIEKWGKVVHDAHLRIE
ncbi:MAG TPA: tripartite tricarboxylate transporter substrate binding protein [Pseudolabrys sp.]|nr:tripartite tricarboxylate transporter substrate binding protein [Pseudolabrys sp.]